MVADVMSPSTVAAKSGPAEGLVGTPDTKVLQALKLMGEKAARGPSPPPVATPLHLSSPVRDSLSSFLPPSPPSPPLLLLLACSLPSPESSPPWVPLVLHSLCLSAPLRVHPSCPQVRILPVMEGENLLGFLTYFDLVRPRGADRRMHLHFTIQRRWTDLHRYKKKTTHVDRSS